MPGLLRGPFRGLPREVAVLTAISFTVALGYGIVAPAIPEFAREFGVSTAATASVVRRPVAVTGCAATACGLLVLAFLPSLGGFLAGLAVAGFGSGLLDVAPAAMIGDMIAGHAGTPEFQAGTLVASYQMADDADSVTGPVAAGYLVDAASYSSAFGLAAGTRGGRGTRRVRAGDKGGHAGGADGRGAGVAGRRPAR